VEYCLKKAETCKKNMDEKLLSKSQAGFFKNNLVVDEFKALSNQLK